jgi:fumarylacetoacetate (FAA) hydrolase
MKIISFVKQSQEFVGIQQYDKVYRLTTLHYFLPRTMRRMLEKWESYMSIALPSEIKLKTEPERQLQGIHTDQVELLAPVPHPGSLRNGSAFGNHKAIQGPGNVFCMPDHLDQLDFKMEVAAVICKPGKNISACDADRYIGGLMIMNDFGRFATSTGPWLVTPDELEPFCCPPHPGHTGKSWDLNMTARVDDCLLSKCNLSCMQWTFAELIERASYGVQLYPGDIIGSGIISTHKLNAGETVELEVEALGILKNKIVKAECDFCKSSDPSIK